MEQTTTETRTIPGTKVLRAAVSEEIVDAALQQLDISLPKSATVEKKVAALAKAFSEGDYDLGECHKCKGVSDVKTFDECPYCGDDGTVTDGTSAAPAAEESVDPDEPSGEDVGDEEAPESGEASATDITEPGEILETAAPEEGEAAAKPKKGPKPKKSKAGAPPKEKSGPTVVKRDGTSAHANGAAKNGASTALATSSAKDLDAAEKKLDASVAEIHKLAESQDRYAYEIGRAMWLVFKDQLWKARRKNGIVQFSTWEQFVRAELNFDMTLRYSFVLMKVAEHLREEDVTKIGITKAKLIVSAPDALQPKLLEQAKTGATTKTIAAKVKAANAKRRPEAGSRARQTKREPSSATITVAALTPSKHRVALYTRSTFGKEKPSPAKRLGDGPSGSIDLVNDVQLRVTVLQSKTGALFAQVDFVRAK